MSAGSEGVVMKKRACAHRIIPSIIRHSLTAEGDFAVGNPEGMSLAIRNDGCLGFAGIRRFEGVS